MPLSLAAARRRTSPAAPRQGQADPFRRSWRPSGAPTYVGIVGRLVAVFASVIYHVWLARVDRQEAQFARGVSGCVVVQGERCSAEDGQRQRLFRTTNAGRDSRESGCERGFSHQPLRSDGRDRARPLRLDGRRERGSVVPLGLWMCVEVWVPRAAPWATFGACLRHSGRVDWVPRAAPWATLGACLRHSGAVEWSSRQGVEWSRWGKLSAFSFQPSGRIRERRCGGAGRYVAVGHGDPALRNGVGHPSAALRAGSDVTPRNAVGHGDPTLRNGALSEGRVGG